MQFSCESKELDQSVNIVKRAISSSNNAPIFSGIHAILQGNTLQLIAMDNTYMMNKKLDVNGEEDGELLIPAKAIGDLLARFDPDEVLTVQQLPGEKEMTLKAAKARGQYHIPLMDPEEYPAMPLLQGDRTLQLPEEIMGKLISTTVYACSTDASRPLYTGVYLEKSGQHLTAVGTNTHRLAIKEVELPEGDDSEFSMLIPARLLKEIGSNLNGELPEPVVLTLKERQIMAQVGNLTIISSLIEGKFPDYKRTHSSVLQQPDGFQPGGYGKKPSSGSLCSPSPITILSGWPSMRTELPCLQRSATWARGRKSSPARRWETTCP